jgi:hypothetical protein
MPRQKLRVGDEVAILPHEHATPELVCEIAIVQHVNETTIHLENGRVYSKISGRGITPESRGMIVAATPSHWAALRARFGLREQ